MDAYFLGAMIGRAFAAYIIVWFVFMLFSKFNLNVSIKKTHSIKGVVIILMIFVFPMLSQVNVDI